MQALGVLAPARHRDDPTRAVGPAAAGAAAAADRSAGTVRGPWSRSSARSRRATSAGRRTARRRCRRARPAVTLGRGSDPPRTRTDASDPCRRHEPRSPSRPTRRTSSVLVRSSFDSSRPTSRTRAPIAAKWLTAARPSPEVGPVTSTVRPASDVRPRSSQPYRRRRTSKPTRLKLGRTSSSRPPSTRSRASMSSSRDASSGCAADAPRPTSIMTRTQPEAYSSATRRVTFGRTVVGAVWARMTPPITSAPPASWSGPSVSPNRRRPG